MATQSCYFCLVLLMLARPVVSWALGRGGRAFHRGPKALLAVGQISVADLKVSALYPSRIVKLVYST